MKGDGMRSLLYVEGGRVRLQSRNGADVTSGFPELQMLAGAVCEHALVLDGELVAFDDAGRVSFGALQPRMHLRRPARVAELVRTVPVTVMLFDVLHVNAASTVRLPYTERRALLESIVPPGPRRQVPVYFEDHAEHALDLSSRLGLEGVVCKRLNSAYLPGRRSSLWRKITHFQAREMVIIGWRPGGGRRSGRVGSLLLGAPDERGRLVYVGHVGTGFTDAMLRDLAQHLKPLEQPEPAFTGAVPREHARDAHWVRPHLVGEVRFAEWTGDKRGLRPHPDSALLALESFGVAPVGLA
ncbi:hypothetical protein [Nonomuraea sp. NPDC050310]|uniref:ATP-dependent DNA ligase n=1 Tax=Nonomuraea sp. NPDC050310 TaxID=3154935 RepID=UPI0033EFC04A